MLTSMDVSVVIPTRNRDRLLRETLASVLAQRDVSVEVIVVDDASTDAILRHGEPRVRVIRHATTRGPNAARNTGAAAAAAPWIAFVDDDDVWAPDKLVTQIEAARTAGRRWVYAGSVNVDARLRVIHGVAPPDPEAVAATLPRFNSIPASASNVVIDGGTFRRLGGFDERMRACEEWELWLRLLSDGIPACVPRPMVAYRMHRTNAILDVAALEAGAEQLERIHGTSIDRGRFHRWAAQLCLRTGDRRGAARQYGLAAIHGAARDVYVDVATLARRNLYRRGIGPPPRRRGGDPAWESLADAWLADLRSNASDVEEPR
jgi:glycosyltransferase involved in cell wall biosynthesis